MSRPRLEALLSLFVSVRPHETSPLLHSSSCFFFILSAYFVVLPLRDEGAISLGLSNLPELFVGSLMLTLVAAPVSTLVFSLPNVSKGKGLVLIHRFFSVSLLVFFLLWYSSSAGCSVSSSKDPLSVSFPLKEDSKVNIHKGIPASSVSCETNGWFYMSVRVGLFLWVALLNLLTISSTWARIIDVMDNESGSRLFGFIGAGATLGQLFGSVFATGMAWLGPYLLVFAALLMELAAQSSKGINQDMSHLEELSPIKKTDPDKQSEADEPTAPAGLVSSPKLSTSVVQPQFGMMLEGLGLILSSTYLLYVSLFLWLSAVVSSFFYFEKVTVIAMNIQSPVGRRRLFAQINSFIAVFILIGQLTLTGRILTCAGVAIAICSAPVVAFLNLVALTFWPTLVVVAVSETIRKVVNYVVTRPGRELLFTVVSQDEKYKAKVCIDVIVQRLGDATAAGMFKFLFGMLNGQTSTVSFFALPVCLLWIVIAIRLGGRQAQLARMQTVSTT